MDSPDARLHLLGQAQALQATDQQQALALQPGFVQPFDMHQAVVAGFVLQGAIQARPALLIHLTPHGLPDLQLGARPQPFGHQLGGAMAEAIGDVVARDDEVFAGVVSPAHDDVHVRVVGVPVVDGRPIEARAKVDLHAGHEVPRIGAQVFEFRAILGREDEAEMVPVVGAAFLEGVEVGFVGPRPVGPARFAIAAHAVALNVAQVLGERVRAGVALIDQQCLEGQRT
ncbi:MAG: hypothetical protein GAK31_02274 [Stenotrophomonas maltophilia]|uniref:Uncharacterized protein n=1 Tax=Stenotrophomonas maltophilia TaxID=40324 RepID=A0A7V8FFW2_STEMA|nr:MAG: hypothetical protein GAK31_02274 [Stenotrophomonas maltophilia]